MAAQRDSSSPSHNSLWPLALLGILGYAWFRSQLAVPIEQLNNSISPETQARQKNEDVDVLSMFSPEVSPADSNFTNSCQYCHHKMPWWKICLEVGTFMALLIYAGITVCVFRQMQKQTEIASSQLEIADRPWIKDTVRSVSDFTFQKGVITWAITIRTENVGHSVATAIFPDAKLIAIKGGDFIDGPRRQVNELCNKLSERFERVKNDPSVWGTAVFPGEHLDFPYNVALMPSEVDNASFDGGANLGKSLFPMLIGCIEYHYKTSEKAHQTGFIYNLSHVDPSLQLPTQVFFSIGKTLPTSDIVLTKSGQYAH